MSDRDFLVELGLDRDEVNRRIEEGIAQLDRGEGIPEDELDSYLAKLKVQLDQ